MGWLREMCAFAALILILECLSAATFYIAVMGIVIEVSWIFFLFLFLSRFISYCDFFRFLLQFFHKRGCGSETALRITDRALGISCVPLAALAIMIAPAYGALRRFLSFPYFLFSSPFLSTHAPAFHPLASGIRTCIHLIPMLIHPYIPHFFPFPFLSFVAFYRIAQNIPSS